MPLPPLALGASASPAVPAPTATQLATLLQCGPLDLDLLNGLFKTLADRIDAVDAADNAIVSSSYNATTNELTFTMQDGAPVIVSMTALVADAVAGAVVTGSSYNASTNMLTLTFGNAQTANIDLTDLIADSVSSAITPSKVYMVWDMANGAIPAGWVVADGANGTRDMRDRIIMGAGGLYANGTTGGADTHSHALTVNSALTGAALNKVTDPNVDGSGGAVTALTGATTFTDPGHIHTASSANASSLPPYLAMVWIMKV